MDERAYLQQMRTAEANHARIRQQEEALKKESKHRFLNAFATGFAGTFGAYAFAKNKSAEDLKKMEQEIEKAGRRLPDGPKLLNDGDQAEDEYLPG